MQHIVFRHHVSEHVFFANTVVHAWSYVTHVTGAMDVDGPLEPGTEAGGGGPMTDGAETQPDDDREIQTQARDEEEEEGALPDEVPTVTLPSRTSRGRAGMSSHPSRSALQLLMDEEDAAAIATAATTKRPRPPSRKFHLVARSRLFELEASVWVFNEYPIRAPLFRVRALRRMPATFGDALTAALAKGAASGLKGLLAVPAGEPLEAAGVNHVSWLEQQVRHVYLHGCAQHTLYEQQAVCQWQRPGSAFWNPQQVLLYICVCYCTPVPHIPVLVCQSGG